MPEIKITAPRTLPRCPNHGCPLEGCGFPLPKHGVGKCPVSGADFEFEVNLDTEEAAVKKDKDGNVVKEGKWKVIGDE